MGWLDDDAQGMGAAVAFYALFSIAPLLVIVIGVAGFWFDTSQVRTEVLAQLGSLIGNEGATAIGHLLERKGSAAESEVATLLAVAAMLFGATSVFTELQTALDHIWRAPTRKRISGWLAFLRVRFLSFGLVLGIGFIVAVSLLLHALMAIARGWWDPKVGEWVSALHVAYFALDYVALTVLFAMIFKILPSVHVAWRDVWIGAIVTAILFNIGNVLIGEYLGWAGHASSFGAGGSFAVLLLWVYYSAQVFLYGAEFTWAYANQLGSRAHEGRSAFTPVREKRSPRRRAEDPQ